MAHSLDKSIQDVTVSGKLITSATVVGGSGPVLTLVFNRGIAPMV